MKMVWCALLAGVMVLLCPMTNAHAETDADEREAAAVFRAMHDDLERCFATTRPNAFVMIEALVDANGRVRAVTATGDARASPLTRQCMERRVSRARFPPPRSGGTSRVRTSFVFAYD